MNMSYAFLISIKQNKKCLFVKEHDETWDKIEKINDMDSMIVVPFLGIKSTINDNDNN